MASKLTLLWTVGVGRGGEDVRMFIENSRDTANLEGT